MKIVFLCGCLEPGRDGVGDYVRRLAIELARLGHQTAAISLNDKYVAQDILTTQQVATDSLPVLRLPATWAASQRFERARHWIVELDAEWLSLQFVPFSFHPKGLCFDLGGLLQPLGHGRAWHFMFHELWVGMDTEASLKHVWWGKAQQYIIKKLIQRLRPRAIHTQTLLYQAQLAQMGFASGHLPLFANISNTAGGLGAFNTVNQAVSSSTKAINLVVFGNIHVGAPVDKLAQDAAQYARANDTAVTLVLMGRCGNEQARWATTWQAAGLPVEILGELEPARISEVLLTSSLGIATTPAVLIGKSGTAAAMQEHGLPVLCVAHAWQPRGIGALDVPAGVAIYTEGNFETYLTQGSAPPSSRLSTVAQQLATSLANSL